VSPELDATRKGMIAAVRNCGHWPTIATLDDYQRAADLAHETDRAIETWTRWRRRFAPDPDRLELGSGRVNVRYEISRALFEQRNELVRLLTEPAPASA
jgi:hypothetical protein